MQNRKNYTGGNTYSIIGNRLYKDGVPYVAAIIDKTFKIEENEINIQFNQSNIKQRPKSTKPTENSKSKRNH